MNRRDSSVKTRRVLARGAGLPAALLALWIGWLAPLGAEEAAPEAAPAHVVTDTGPPRPHEDAAAVVCRRIAGKLASVSYDECLATQLETSGAVSVTGTPILLREFEPIAEREPLGRVLLIGGIHGDEYSAVTIVFKWLSVLNRFHSGLFHWRIVPLLNPDGLLRKRSQRMNHRGVDLNRNFPTPNWAEESEDYWVRRTGRNPRRFPGHEPLSEPESQWLAEEIERFRPSVVVAIHAPSHVVDYDGPPEAPERLGPLELKQIGTYPGSLGRYAGHHLGLSVVTIELPSAGIMPPAADQMKIWTDLVAWLQQHVVDHPTKNREWVASAHLNGVGPESPEGSAEAADQPPAPACVPAYDPFLPYSLLSRCW